MLMWERIIPFFFFFLEAVRNKKFLTMLLTEPLLWEPGRGIKMASALFSFCVHLFALAVAWSPAFGRRAGPEPAIAPFHQGRKS